ncbi:flagellar hook-basal body complex protein FliE [Cribrihabitans marinus]|uniref:Flagellar hook-basal body complex protein FliE n=1 Tax=Cribrihabitans marinus TaxID=1227549 RepID=A0A1H7DP89_9RHOB|nr:flagellar hook-basal body complex protein FliE [Cribrihabitans marinus]GGH39524.1 flagellar hook-basal body protein FliE [Cribrihabitans marinus]SEK01452.1 flagellar hook-basal body complex protein FliE [Cribrihabitans marinus]
MDIRSFSAAQNYASARPATQADPNTAGAVDGLRQGFRDFAATLQQGEETAQAAMIGQADPHALVQALAQSELAVETAVTVRNKVVEAYQEILRMPV